MSNLFSVDGLGDLLGDYVKVGAEVAKDNLVYSQSERLRDERTNEARSEYQARIPADEPPPSALDNTRTFISGNYMLMAGGALAVGFIIYLISKK